MVTLLKIKRRDFFFNETAFLFWCHALWKLGSSNCCIFEMKHATGMETCIKIYFLFIFNLVQIRIRKTSLFWLYNLMTSQWKPSINCVKPIPCTGAHAYVAHIWKYLPGGSIIQFCIVYPCVHVRTYLSKLLALLACPLQLESLSSSSLHPNRPL